MNERVSLALLPLHLDYIVRVLRRCPWEESNPMLVDIDMQVRAQQESSLNAQPNGHAQQPPEALS